jgi:hypothetical protein
MLSGTNYTYSHAVKVFNIKSVIPVNSVVPANSSAALNAAWPSFSTAGPWGSDSRLFRLGFKFNPRPGRGRRH